MEPFWSGPVLKFLRLGVVIAVTLGAFALLSTKLGGTTISKYIPRSAPEIALSVSLLDFDGNPLPPEKSNFSETIPPAAVGPLQDSQQTPTPTKQWDYTTPTPVPTKQHQSLSLQLRPIAVSIALPDSNLAARVESNRSFQEFFQSPLIQGLIGDLGNILGVQARDLQLEGTRGLIVRSLLNEILASHPIVHFEPVRGRRSGVLEVSRKGFSALSVTLPLLLRATTQRRYSLPGFEIAELSLAGQTIFVTEYDSRLFIARSVPALLNVLQLRPSVDSYKKASVVVRVRAEAWLRNLLPALTDEKTLYVDTVFHWEDDKLRPTLLRSSDSHFVKTLSPKLAPGVVAAVPKDSFLAIVSSTYVPQEYSWDDWNSFARDQPTRTFVKPHRSGASVVWDLSPNVPGFTNVGIAISRDPKRSSALSISDIFSSSFFRGTCAADSVWLAASSELLLTRMKESCERESLSLLSMYEKEGRTLPTSMLASFSPGAGMQELLAGTVRIAEAQRLYESDNPVPQPSWLLQYKEAVHLAKLSGTKSLATLPSLLFEGEVQENQVRLIGRHYGKKQ